MWRSDLTGKNIALWQTQHNQVHQAPAASTLDFLFTALHACDAPAA